MSSTATPTSFRSRIRIDDTGADYVVTLQADLSRIFTTAGVAAGVVALLVLAAVGFSWEPLAFGIIVFLAVSIVRYLGVVIFFPVYFTGLRNDIERSIRSRSYR